MSEIKNYRVTIYNKNSIGYIVKEEFYYNRLSDAINFCVDNGYKNYGYEIYDCPVNRIIACKFYDDEIDD